MTASRGTISAVFFSAIAVPAPAQEAVAPAVGSTAADATGDTTAATGQRAAENAVRSAGDAFGTSIGRETIGLYNCHCSGIDRTDAATKSLITLAPTSRIKCD